MDVAHGSRRQLLIKLGIEGIDFAWRDLLERTIAQGRDDVQSKELGVAFERPGVESALLQGEPGCEGSWLMGPEKSPVSLGKEFIVHGAKQGWVRLVRGEPPQRIPREPDKAFPTREMLPDQDKSKWPTFDGEPSDPWSLANELLMTERETGQPVIFTSMYYSGREAVEDLCRLIVFQRRQRGDNAKPIVAIGNCTRSSKRGPYVAPAFTLIGWAGETEAPPPPPSELANDLSEHLQARSTISPAKTTAPLPRPRRRKTVPDAGSDLDLNDEIPY
jgi:hypothetical protein